MGMHKNARLTPLGRERLVRLIESGQTPKAVAEAVGVRAQKLRKCVARYQSEGVFGSLDGACQHASLHDSGKVRGDLRANGFAG